MGCTLYRKGFTLIELLIVVAIIGILAAIAVPNFLNAQTRAKVARVKSDLHAISAAQEMYYVDFNNYAPAYKLLALTTPVAYMGSLPQDPFTPKWDAEDGGNQGVGPNPYITWYRYVLGSLDYRIGGGEAERNGLCADYWAYFPPFLPRGQAMDRARERDCPVQWMAKSLAGNINTQTLCGNGDDCTLRYDPSNGLLSVGDIAIFGPGGITD